MTGKDFFLVGNRLLCRQQGQRSSLLLAERRREASAPLQRVMRTIVDSPSSPYAEAIRSIKLTVDLNSQA